MLCSEIYTDKSLELIRTYEDSGWNHDTSTPYRSETNWTVERVVRRVKEGTASVLVQCGPSDGWWSDAMKCYCYLRENFGFLCEWAKIPYNMLSRIFIGCALLTGGGWPGDLPIVDWEDLEKNISSEVNVKGFQSQQVQVTTAHGQKTLHVLMDRSLKQEGHVVSRLPLSPATSRRRRRRGGQL